MRNAGPPATWPHSEHKKPHSSGTPTLWRCAPGNRSAPGSPWHPGTRTQSESVPDTSAHSAPSNVAPAQTQVGAKQQHRTHTINTLTARLLRLLQESHPHQTPQTPMPNSDGAAPHCASALPSPVHLHPANGSDPSPSTAPVLHTHDAAHAASAGRHRDTPSWHPCAVCPPLVRARHRAQIPSTNLRQL